MSRWWPRWTRWSPRRPERRPRAGNRYWSTGSRSLPPSPGNCSSVSTRCARRAPGADRRHAVLSITDQDGRLIAAVTRRELETAVRRGTRVGPAARGGPVRAHSRTAALRTHPRSHLPAPRLRQPRRLGRPRPRRRARRGRGDRLRQPVLPLSPASPAEDPREGWLYVMTIDGVLSVTTPSGVTRASRPPGLRSGTLEMLRTTRSDNRSRTTSTRRPSDLPSAGRAGSTPS